jgi:hypothetical protein
MLLTMISTYRKNELLPIHLDPEQFEAIFRHIREHSEQPQSKRVEEVLELLSGLRDDLTTPEKIGVITRLRNVLSNYRWSVHVSPTREGLRVVHFPADRGGLSPSDKWEYDAVRDLLELVPYVGKRPRIRRCAECKEWLFVTGRRRFCDSSDRNCRQRHYDSKPEIRESKKLYMSKYREDEKKRQKNRKTGVGFRGRVTRRVGGKKAI